MNIKFHEYKMAITVSLDVTPCCLMEWYWHFWRNLLCTLMAEKRFLKMEVVGFSENVCRFVRL